MTDKFIISTFLKRFSNDEKCLEKIKHIRWPEGVPCPKCKKITKFYKVTGRTAYACEFCGTHVFPLAGTVFEKTSTPLKLWFYAMFLMINTRAGISAKQLQRELGITYKTAWRIFHQLRKLMAENNGEMLNGVVEIDETFIGGKEMNRATKPNFGEIPKETVMGMIQRNGKAYLKHIPNTGKWTLLKQIQDNVDPKARIVTDEWPGYTQLYRYGFNHDVVNHGKRIYVTGDIHTNNAENVWSHLKRGIYGVYRVVSKKYLQAYADEYAWRYNNRFDSGKMFDNLLKQIAEVKLVKVGQLV